MKRSAILKIHIVATAIAVLCIGTFFTLSLVAEIQGDHVFILWVKTFILYALPVLLISMPLLGISGNKLAGNSKSPLVKNKKRRMKLVFINGMLLISLAIFLYYKAANDSMDADFFTAQVLELVLGAVNLVLLGLNVKAGMMIGSLKLKR